MIHKLLYILSYMSLPFPSPQAINPAPPATISSTRVLNVSPMERRSCPEHLRSCFLRGEKKYAMIYYVLGMI